jgi:hypothetical protein
MQVRQIRSLLPEIILGLCLVIVITVSMLGSNSNACHNWKHRLNTMASVLTSGRDQETLAADEQRSRAELRARARSVLDERPFACF